MAIQSFANRRIEAFFLSSRVPRAAGWVGLARVVTRKLDMLHYAHTLADLRSPPGDYGISIHRRRNRIAFKISLFNLVRRNRIFDLG